MAGIAKGTRLGGKQECTICSHPGLDQINTMILNSGDHTYTDILAAMKRQYPDHPELTKASISRHKQKHLFGQAIVEVDENGKERTTYLSGATRSDLLTVDPAALEIPAISLRAALNIILTAGVRNILTNPGTVTPRTAIEAAALLKELGANGEDAEDWEEAWAGLSEAKQAIKGKTLRQAAKGRRKTTTTVEEEFTAVQEAAVPEAPPQDGIIEGEVLDDDWDNAPLRLPAPSEALE